MRTPTRLRYFGLKFSDDFLKFGLNELKLKNRQPWAAGSNPIRHTLKSEHQMLNELMFSKYMYLIHVLFTKQYQILTQENFLRLKNKFYCPNH